MPRGIKGHTNNPKGRPKKGETLTDALRAKIDRDEIADKLYEIAMSGDLAALKYVYDRIDGTPKQTIAGDGENPLMGFIIERAERTED